METYIAETRVALLETTDTALLDEEIARIEAAITDLNRGALSSLDVFRKNVLASNLKEKQQQRSRRTRKRALFHELIADARDAEHHRLFVEQRQNSKRARMAADIPAPSAMNEIELTLRDVIQVDNVQPSSTPINDKCVNCNTPMRRDACSQLVCLDCGFVKTYVDTSNLSSAAAGSYTLRSGSAEDDASVPKQLLHFLTFLSACQGKTTREFDKDLIQRLCKYAYVQGCRKPEDINKDIVNKAQRFEGGSTEHTRSILYTVMLRGKSVRYPRDVLQKTQLMFRKLWPAYFVNKELLYKDRSNTQAYKFIARMIFRMLGVPFLLSTVEPFKMMGTKLMHSSFTRIIFKKDLHWKWEDGRVTEEGITDEMIDTYEKARDEKNKAQKSFPQITLPNAKRKRKATQSRSQG